MMMMMMMIGYYYLLLLTFLQLTTRCRSLIIHSFGGSTVLKSLQNGAATERMNNQTRASCLLTIKCLENHLFTVTVINQQQRSGVMLGGLTRTLIIKPAVYCNITEHPHDRNIFPSIDEHRKRSRSCWWWDHFCRAVPVVWYCCSTSSIFALPCARICYLLSMNDTQSLIHAQLTPLVEKYKYN